MQRPHGRAPSLADCRRALGVSEGVTFAELRAAYLRRALLAHPDKGGSTEKFQVVIAAFEFLAEWSKSVPADGATAEDMSKSSPARRPAPPQKEAAAGEPSQDIERFPKRLHALLSSLDPARRRSVIGKMLTEEQRLALEQWIQFRKTCEDQQSPSAESRASGKQSCRRKADDSESPADEDDSDTPPELGFLFVCDGLEDSMLDGIDEHVGIDSMRLLVHDSAADMAHTQSSPDASSSTTSSRAFRPKGISKRSKSYYASIMINWFAIQGRGRINLVDAIADHTMLVAIKRNVLESQASAAEFGKHVHRAVLAISAEFGIDSRGWVGWAQVPAFYWIGSQLKTPIVGWEPALDTWRKLVDCLGYCVGSNHGKIGFLGRPGMTPELADDMWAKLRGEYLKVVGESGWPVEFVHDRLRQAEELRRPIRQSQAERWRRWLQTKADGNDASADRTIGRIRHLIAQEAERVQTADRRAARAAEADRKRRRLEERKRWRWSNDFTMGDLLAGR